jgi:Uma2 family endonuclease
MATVAAKKKQPVVVGPASNGTLMTPREFDAADFEDGWRYELINGVLIVAPIPSDGEVEPNSELDCLLRNYRNAHPELHVLTHPERYVKTRTNRRKADRQIWVGFTRKPKKNEPPTIVIEFVSKRKRDRDRDYETNRDEYAKIGVKEYWIIDRFERSMTVFARVGGRMRKRVISENQNYTTDLLPGFELPLAHLFKLADFWESDSDEDE